MKLEIHVRPSASNTAVGGSHGGALVVRVREPASEGRATRSALDAVAMAFGVPRYSVDLILGATSRRKLVEVSAGDDDERLRMRLEELLRAG